jgi:hypothetical protein
MPLPLTLIRPGAARAVDAARVEAARAVVGIERELSRAGRTILDELSAGFATGDHYPPGEVWDPVSHAQYFYHAHPAGERAPGEHGHFHTFLGIGGMPAGMTPLVLPEMAVAPQCDSHGRGVGTHRSPRDRGVVSHLIGISLDPAGRPIALFTTNRWVTGETWFRGEDVALMLGRFDFVEPGPHDRVSRWLAATIGVLRPVIVDLALARDARIMDWRRRRSRQSHVFDDRRLEVTSERRIDFAAELSGLLAARGQA